MRFPDSHRQRSALGTTRSTAVSADQASWGQTASPSPHFKFKVERVVPNAFCVLLCPLQSRVLGTSRPTGAQRAAPPVRPIVFRGAQLFHHRIQPDVMPCFLTLLRVPDAVVEEVLLPSDPVQPCRRPLPIARCHRQPRLARTGHQGVQVIRHEQHQFAPPPPSDTMVVLGRTQ
jgi:hypothetical protein